MKRQMSVILASLILAQATHMALAELERVGPNDPVNGYPIWYQDGTGVPLELGLPLNQAELNGGWCLILPADVPSGTAPETFPTDFAGEHFYWAADAGINFAGGRARLVLALEAAFITEDPAPGDQVVFGRVRIRVDDLPFDGDYTVYTPYGVFVFHDQPGGERLFHTVDLGLEKPFNGPLHSHIGPFLLPSDTPGGAELLPVTGPVPGKFYIAEPTRSGPVTGSPLPAFTSPVDGITRNHNIFRIEGPNGFVIQTFNFTMVGRLYTGVIPGLVTIDRASYTRNPSVEKVDVFATGRPTLPSRPPTFAIPSRFTPVLSFYNALPGVDPATGQLIAPVGQPEIPMAVAGTHYWAQAQPPAIPSGVTVKDAASRNILGQLTPTFMGAPVTDEITITDAIYNPTGGGSLLVEAFSSDSIAPVTLSLAGFGNLAGGQIAFSPLTAPPARVQVLSSAGGIALADVVTLLPLDQAYCGMPGTAYLDMDRAGPAGSGPAHRDCRVNLYDLAYLAEQWLQCTDPADPTCTP